MGLYYDDHIPGSRWHAPCNTGERKRTDPGSVEQDLGLENEKESDHESQEYNRTNRPADRLRRLDLLDRDLPRVSGLIRTLVDFGRLAASTIS